MMQDRFREAILAALSARWRGRRCDHGHTAVRRLAGALGAVFLTALLSLGMDCARAARLALLIGNDNYQNVPALRNARGDAETMASALKQVGYATEVRKDLDLRGLQAALRDFKAKVQEGDEVVFFYSGHGVQMDNANFLLPVDIHAPDSADRVRDESIPLQAVQDAMAERRAQFSLLIIDACRNDPFPKRSRAVATRGLAAALPANGQMVIFSAGANQEALDRLGDKDPVRNGVFTRVFLREMMSPGVTVRDVLLKVRQTVFDMAKSVNHTQVPAIYDQALGDFYFVPPKPGQKPSGGSDPHAAEIAMWTPLKDSRDPVALQNYLNIYPNGLFVDLAREALRKLGVTAVSGGGDVPKNPGQTFRQCDVCPAMVVIGPGALPAAADKARPKQPTVSNALAVGVYEVTFREWDACAADRACAQDVSDENWGRENQPVINVSWNDAKAYVTWLSRKTGQTYRLLREAEWEYAARGGTLDLYPWGSDVGIGLANCLQCGALDSGRRPTEVGKFGANGFGLYDVIGNVWEWVEDCKSSDMKSLDEPAAGSGCSERVLRGGSFRTAAGEATLERRRGGAPAMRSSQNGFRVARDL